MNAKTPLTSLKDTLQGIEQSLTPVIESEELSLLDSLGRILSDNITSTINVPGHTNSAMDGFALRKAELEQSSNFKVAGEVFAGNIFTDKLNSFECVRIMTGASIPEGLDFIVPQEYVHQDNNSITIEGYTGGSNVRLAGEDLAIGDIALHQGRKLTANDVALLASLGLSNVKVYRKLRVGFFSTGDELIEPGDEQQPGQIYDSNRFAIHSMLNALGAEPINLGIVLDDPAAIKAAFIKAVEKADVILTSGGVSVGDADYVKQVLNETGKINLWRINIKPGKPLAFGTIDNTYFFALPGNPVSSAIVFYKIVKPMLKILSGETSNIYPIALTATLTNPIAKKSSRMEFMRGVLTNTESGAKVSVPEAQGSGMLSSMYKANCLVILDEATKNLEAGCTVTVEPFYGLI